MGRGSRRSIANLPAAVQKVTLQEDNEILFFSALSECFTHGATLVWFVFAQLLPQPARGGWWRLALAQKAELFVEG